MPMPPAGTASSTHYGPKTGAARNGSNCTNIPKINQIFVICYIVGQLPSSMVARMRQVTHKALG